MSKKDPKSSQAPQAPQAKEIQKTIRNIIWVVVIGVVVVVVLTIAQMMIMKWAKDQDASMSGTTQEVVATTSEQAPQSNGVEGVAGMQIGGDFTLTRHDGEIVTYADLKNTPHVLFFGFTYCPDICPTELALLANIMEDMGQETVKDLRVIFVSVDPERDDVEQMKSYVSLFHPKIEGLTGTPEQIDDIKKKYRIYSAKVQTPEMSDYTVDHSSFLYMFDRSGQLQSMYRSGAQKEDVQKGIEQLLGL